MAFVASRVERRRPVLAIPFIAGFVSLVYVVGIAVVLALGLPWDLTLPLWARVLGASVFVVGLAFSGWAGLLRGWRATLESSYATLVKLLRRRPLEERHGRTEPLVVAGPYRFVRHPMYAGVVLLAFGIALAVDRTAALVAAIVLWAWFYFVLGPFEERELVALFGGAYVDYMHRTPRLIPLPRRRR